jgi:hypothetical protein
MSSSVSSGSALLIWRSACRTCCLNEQRRDAFCKQVLVWVGPAGLAAVRAAGRSSPSTLRVGIVKQSLHTMLISFLSLLIMSIVIHHVSARLRLVGCPPSIRRNSPCRPAPLRLASPRLASPRCAAPRCAAPRCAAPRCTAPRRVAPRHAAPLSSRLAAPRRFRLASPLTPWPTHSGHGAAHVDRCVIAADEAQQVARLLLRDVKVEVLDVAGRLVGHLEEDILAAVAL